MLYKVIAVSYLAAAYACDSAAVTTCVAKLTLPSIPTKDLMCTYLTGYMECIGASTCCEDTGVKALVDALNTGAVKEFACSMTCTDAAPCFGIDTHATLSTGEQVLMSSLKAGDYVLPGPTRVVVNQHAKASLSSGLLEIQHADGALKLTPDHVLSVDGKFVAAREATVGTKLGNSEVSRVSHSVGGIINPLTTSGKITAEGVLATTYPEWIASFALSYPVYLTVGNALSFLFPATTQAYYDSVLESFFASTVSSLKAVPAPLLAIVFHLADLLVSAGLVLYTLASLKTVLAIAAVTAMTKGRK